MFLCFRFERATFCSVYEGHASPSSRKDSKEAVVTFCTQSYITETLVYTPGSHGCPQPLPQEMIPTSQSFLYTAGPPLSPVQASLLPSGTPKNKINFVKDF